MDSLKDRLKDWTDFDGAEYELGVVLGIFKDFRIAGGSWLDHAPKWVFWTNNPLGNQLMEMLQALVEVDILEYDDEDLRFRWNDQTVSQLLKTDSHGDNPS